MQEDIFEEKPGYKLLQIINTHFSNVIFHIYIPSLTRAETNDFCDPGVINGDGLSS